MGQGEDGKTLGMEGPGLLTSRWPWERHVSSVRLGFSGVKGESQIPTSKG